MRPSLPIATRATKVIATCSGVILDRAAAARMVRIHAAAADRSAAAESGSAAPARQDNE